MKIRAFVGPTSRLASYNLAYFQKLRLPRTIGQYYFGIESPEPEPPEPDAAPPAPPPPEPVAGAEPTPGLAEPVPVVSIVGEVFLEPVEFESLERVVESTPEDDDVLELLQEAMQKTIAATIRIDFIRLI